MGQSHGTLIFRILCAVTHVTWVWNPDWVSEHRHTDACTEKPGDVGSVHTDGADYHFNLEPQCVYYTQERGRRWLFSVGSLCRWAASDHKHREEEETAVVSSCTHWSLICAQSPEEYFAIPLSLTWTRLCHSHGAETLPMWTVHGIFSLGTSSVAYIYGPKVRQELIVSRLISTHFCQIWWYVYTVLKFDFPYYICC